MNKRTNPQKYIFIVVVIILAAICAFLIVRSVQDDSSRNSGLHPQNGTYTIKSVKSMQCTLKFPPDCTGEIILTPEGKKELEAKVDRDTKVRYQSKEIQIYPDALTAGMTGQATFKPDSGIMDTFVIAD